MPIVRRSDCVPLPIVVRPVKEYEFPFRGQKNIGSGTQLDLLTMGINMPETC